MELSRLRGRPPIISDLNERVRRSTELRRINHAPLGAWWERQGVYSDTKLLGCSLNVRAAPLRCSHLNRLTAVLVTLLNCGRKRTFRVGAIPPSLVEESGEAGPLAKARASGRSRNLILAKEVNRY
jgi:hypothetical protein